MESTTVPRDDWQNIWANRPEFYWGGARQANPKIYSGYATTIDGIATFYLTKDGTPEGEAIFTSVDLGKGIHISPREDNIALICDVSALSSDKKTLTVNVNSLGVEISRAIEDGYLINLPDTSYRSEYGRRTFNNSSVTVPSFTPPGTYHIAIYNKVYVNPLRVITVKRVTEDFEVVR